MDMFDVSMIITRPLRVYISVCAICKYHTLLSSFSHIQLLYSSTSSFGQNEEKRKKGERENDEEDERMRRERARQESI